MSAIDRITVDPEVCGGRPCIPGLRVRVKDVLDLLAAGASHAEVLADYPYLESDDIRAVLARRLQALGHTAAHVAWRSASDSAIRDYAASVGAVIVTKDEDFAIRRV